MLVFGEMPMGCVLPTRASSVWWLATAISMAAAVWCLLLPEGSPTAHPLISSMCALISGRPLPLHASMLGATMEVDEERTTGEDLVRAGGSLAHPQRRLFWRSYGAGWLPVFIITPLPLQAEGRPPLSSLPMCYMGGSYTIYSEFVARSRGCEGAGVPSGSSPATTMLDLDGCCFGPDCKSCFQSGVLLEKIRDLRVILFLLESLYELCTVTAVV